MLKDAAAVLFLIVGVICASYVFICQGGISTVPTEDPQDESRERDAEQSLP